VANSFEDFSGKGFVVRSPGQDHGAHNLGG
jgi:hypothetical protein